MYPTTFDGIHIGGVYVHEPGGVLSNFLIVLAVLWMLMKIGKVQSEFQKYWKLFILFIGLGAAGGMASHGFPTYFGESGFYWVWAAKSALIPVANVFAVLGALSDKSALVQKWQMPLWIKAIVVTIAFMWVYNFVPVIIDLLVTYIIVLVNTSKKRKSDPAFKLLHISFVFALVTGLLYPLKLDLHHLWFTHKDLAHIFAIISLAIVYKSIEASRSTA